MLRSNKVQKLDNADALPIIICNADGSPVRKVGFSFGYNDLTAQQNITESLFSYVIRHGRIKSWYLWPSATYTNGSVHFEQPEHATRLLNQPGRKFAGTSIHFWDYKNMLSLPDKCLQDIFRKLDFDDLLSVAQVNERFKENAKSIFLLKFGSFNIKIRRVQNEESKKWMKDIRNLEKFLPVFGKSVAAIEIDYRAFDSLSINRAMELFALHCSDSLKSLRLKRFRLRLEENDALVSTMEPLLAELTSLEIVRCEVSNQFIESLAHCRELNRLEIITTSGDFQSFQFTLPKLELIDFFEVIGLDQQQMETFLRQNAQLKIVNFGGIEGLSSIFSTIGQYLPQIEKLSLLGRDFIFIDQPTFNRNEFASLQKLSIQCYTLIDPVSILAALSALVACKVPLKLLSLYCFPDDQLIEAISQLKTIRTLFMLYGDYSISRFLRIIDNLKELECLGLHLDNVDADGMIQIVRNAEKLQRLILWESSAASKINTASCAALVDIIKNRAVHQHLEMIAPKVYWPSNPDPTHQKFLTFSSASTAAAT